jgi:hypothetical protein
MQVSVKVTGDVKGVVSMAKQITYAAKQTCVVVMQEAQPVVITTIKRNFHVRGSWFEPGNRFGVHVRFTRSKSDLSANLETYADWLEEHETGGTRTTDKHAGHLTIPQVGAEKPRVTILSVVPAKFKARRILPNVTEFIDEIFKQGKIRLGTTRAGRAGKKGNIAAARFFINKKQTAIFERTDDHRLVLFYTLAHAVRIKKQSAVTDPTIKLAEARFGSIFNTKFAEAMRTAK